MADGPDETERTKYWRLSDEVIGSCIEVHRHLGPGLLESAYQQCLCQELSLRGLRFEREQAVPVAYKGISLDCGYRVDLIVENKLLVELKAVERLLNIHEAQVITYLRLTGFEVGLLVNFNAIVLRDGIRRLRLKRRTPG